MEHGMNQPSGDKLLSYIQRIETIRETKAECADDEAVVMAEAKAEGFRPKTIRKVLQVRAMKPREREEEEALLDLYLHQVGMAPELPLFRNIEMLASDSAGRDNLIKAMSAMVPVRGEIILTVAGETLRFWRDDEGKAHSQKHEPETASTRSAPTKPKVPAKPKRPTVDVPDVDEDGATELGRVAARENQPVIRNPFPSTDSRRRSWDSGWREVAGSDGMGPDE